jgi:hypothetical protein
VSIFKDHTSENVMLETTENLRSGYIELTPLPAELEPLLHSQSPVQEVGVVVPVDNKNEIQSMGIRAALENKIDNDQPN